LLPRWSRNGRELFYVRNDRRLTAVSVVTDGPFRVLNSTELFTGPSTYYDVAPDGRFLFNVAATSVGPLTPITVVLNWTSGVNVDAASEKP
jgi:Tol biopolymer transport system component